jgi:uncharacterized protein (UPF0335 family)
MSLQNTPSPRPYIDTVLEIRHEQKKLGRDMKRVMEEAKAAGLDKTALRTVIRAVERRRKYERQGQLNFLDEQASLVGNYLDRYYKEA